MIINKLSPVSPSLIIRWFTLNSHLNIEDATKFNWIKLRYLNVGTYDITLTGLSADNYELAYYKGTLKVNKAEVNVPEAKTDGTGGRNKQIHIIVDLNIPLSIIDIIRAKSIEKKNPKHPTHPSWPNWQL